MNLKIEKIIKSVNTLFVAVFVSVMIVIVAGFIASDKSQLWNPLSEEAINLTSFFYIYTIATIPLTFFLCNKYIKKWAKEENEDKKLNSYQQAASARVILVGSSALIGSIIYFFFINTSSVMFCSGISLLSLFFCRLNEAKVEQELELRKPEEVDENGDNEMKSEE